MFFSVAVTVGSPKANPESVRPKDSGSGKTGRASSPKTRPENQRFVGGIRPSARRLAFRSLSVFLVMAVTSESTCEAGNTSLAPAFLVLVMPGSPVPAPQAAAPTATEVAASEASSVLRDKVFRRRGRVIVLVLSETVLLCFRKIRRLT